MRVLGSNDVHHESNEERFFRRFHQIPLTRSHGRKRNVGRCELVLEVLVDLLFHVHRHCHVAFHMARVLVVEKQVMDLETYGFAQPWNQKHLGVP